MLPVPATGLVGRRREIAAVAALLQDPDTRLVTLTGPGGVGKTRLSLEIAHAVSGAFPDGIFFVDLSRLRDPVLVASAIARGMDVQESADHSVIDAISARVRNRRQLLVLDNFEHLMPAAPQIAQLLHSVPSARLLITSRSPLRVRGERAFPLAPLRTSSGETAASEIDSDNDALALLLDRAQAVNPDFDPNADERRVLIEICRRLDGLPLAIELAAARLKVLSPRALLDRLADPLRVLTSAPRDAPDRQRTMRDAIAWSYELLAPPEQALFRSMAAFVGGCSLEAAEAVAPNGSDVLEGVSALIESSLVRRDGQPSGEQRYAMLETIREFGLELLDAGGELAAAQARHAEWCLAIVGNVDSAGWVWPTRERLDRLESELPNLRAAMSWFEAHGDREQGLQIATGLYVIWMFRSRRVEGRSWLERLLTTAENDGTSKLHAMAANVLALLDAFLGDDRATIRINWAMKLWRSLDDPHGFGLCLLSAGMVAQFAGDPRGAEPLLTEAADRLADVGDSIGVAISRMQLGHAKRELGELAHAEALFLDSLAACRTLGYEHGLAATLIPLIDLAMDRRDLLQAVTYTAESLTLWQAMGLLEGLIDSLLRAGWLAIQGSRHEPAAILLGAGMAMTGSLSYALLRRDRELSETVATSARSAIGEAAFAAALDAGAKLSPAQATARALTLLPELTFSAPRISAPPAPLTTLTARELEVLKLLVAGRTNPEIADSLFVSPVTIRTHVTNILAKLGVSSRTEAAARAVRDGLI